MSNYLLVALGGATGAMLRYGLSRVVPQGASGWPWPTLMANVGGGLLIGILAGWASARGAAAEPWRILLGVGVLGGFTTFSAYSLETARLIERGRAAEAGAYAVGSVLLALAAVFIGLWAARRWAS